jgi:hypothetical protein
MMMLKAAPALALLVLGTAALAQATRDTPPPATNQCWDTSTNLLRDKTSPTSTEKTKEVVVGRDQSPGAPAPPSRNAMTGGKPDNPNPVRPPGVTDC